MRFIIEGMTSILNTATDMLSRSSHDRIWAETIGPAYDCFRDDHTYQYGLNPETSKKYQEAANLSDVELWKSVEAGEL